MDSSSDKDNSIKHKIADEGIQARNLIKYNVPVYSRKKNSSMTEHKTSPNVKLEDNISSLTAPQECGDILSNRPSTPLIISTSKAMCKSSDYRAKYWGKMMDTLKRTIDEIYSACETDESEAECKEVIMILENSIKDFYSLIEKMNLFKKIQENPSSQNRPYYIAWDERKISPGKPIMKQVLEKSKRAHSFSGHSSSTVSQTDMSASMTGNDSITKFTQTAQILEIPATTTILSINPQTFNQYTQTQQPIITDEINPTQTNTTTTKINTTTTTYPITWADKVKRNTDDNQVIKRQTISNITKNKTPTRKNTLTTPNTTPTIRARPNTTIKSRKHQSQNYGNNNNNNMKTKASTPIPTIHNSTTTDEWEIVNRNKTIRSWNKSISSNSTTATTSTQPTTNSNKTSLLISNRVLSDPHKDISNNNKNNYNNNNQDDNNDNNKNNNHNNQTHQSRRTVSSTSIYTKQRNKSKSESNLQHKSDSDHNLIRSDKKSDSIINRDQIIKSNSVNVNLNIDDDEDEDDDDDDDDEDEIDIDDDSDDDDDEDDDDAVTNESIIQLEKKLADVQNEETELESELGRAKEEENRARLTVEITNDDHAIVEIQQQEQVVGQPTTTQQSNDLIFNNNDYDNFNINDKNKCDYINDDIDDINNIVDDDMNIYDNDDDGYDIILDQNQLKMMLMTDSFNNESLTNNSISTNSSVNNLSLLPLDEIQINTPSITNNKETINEKQNNNNIPLDGSINVSEDSKLFSMDWSQMKEDLDDDFEDDDSISKMRIPGRCVSLHQKLSAPLRKSSKQQLEEKHAKANEMREKILSKRTDRVKELTKKVEEVRRHKTTLIEQRKNLLEQRMNKADVKRQKQLDEKVKKAQDEEQKGKEIAFIQSLEGAQKKYTIFTKHQESEARLLEIEEKRKKKYEKKQQQEAAAENRRKTIESQRETWLKGLQQKWKSREEERAWKAENKERQRLDAVKAREAERELKKQNVEQQQKSFIEQLKEKITKKHEDGERRHLESLAEISRKAFEMSVTKYLSDETVETPAIEPYLNKKWCNLCNVMIDSDILLQSHLNGKKHKSSVKEKFNGESMEMDKVNFNLEHLVDAPDDKPDPKIQAKKDRRKAIKKKMKKIRQKIITPDGEIQKIIAFLTNEKSSCSLNKSKYLKFVKDIRRNLAIQDTGPWVTTRITSLEKSFSDLFRNWDSLDKIKIEQNCLLSIGLTDIFSNIIQLIANQKSEKTLVLPEKTIVNISKFIRKFVINNERACIIILYTLFVVNLIEALQNRLTILVPENFQSIITKLSAATNQTNNNSNNNCINRELPINPVVECIMEILTILFNCFLNLCCPINSTDIIKLCNVDNKIIYDNKTQLQYVLNYIISIGIVDKLSDYLSQVRGPLKENSPTAYFVLRALSFLSSLLKILDYINSNNISSSESSIQTNSISVVNDSSHLTTQISTDSSPEKSQLLISIEENEMCGLICLMYGLLLYQGNSDFKNEKLPLLSGKIAIAGLKLINNLAVVSLPTMQNVLSLEGTYLQLRHILSYLISYCTSYLNRNQHLIVFNINNNNNNNNNNNVGCNNNLISSSQSSSSITASSSKSTVTVNTVIENSTNSLSTSTSLDTLKKSKLSASLQLLDNDNYSVQEMLHELILCVGYFCVHNTENQNFVQTGQRPTILQQLCQLPFGYFSQKSLSQCLYPTLISCCFKNDENTAVLEQEMTCKLLSSFLQEKINEYSSEKKINEDNDNPRFQLSKRFHVSCWEEAKIYFQR